MKLIKIEWTSQFDVDTQSIKVRKFNKTSQSSGKYSKNVQIERNRK